MKPSRLSITGFSTALYSTWYFIDDLSLLLDCGDGACAGLLQKSRKVRTIAVSHADRDHLAGLPQFLQVNVREPDLPVVLFPRDCGSFPAMRDFLHRFDRFHLDANQGNRWEAVEPGQEIDLGKANSRLIPFLNRHIDSDVNEVKSLSYRVEREHHQLREGYRGRPPEDIARARQNLGDDEVLQKDRETLLVYSADTPIERASFWGETRVLIHESTFLHADDARSRNQELRHSSLDQVIPMATELNLEALILGHFSTRYRESEIRRALEIQCRKHRPSFSVFAVMPGRCQRDILGGEPVWAP